VFNEYEMNVGELDGFIMDLNFDLYFIIDYELLLIANHDIIALFDFFIK
jgi:hypothetical protein